MFFVFFILLKQESGSCIGFSAVTILNFCLTKDFYVKIMSIRDLIKCYNKAKLQRHTIKDLRPDFNHQTIKYYFR